MARTRRLLVVALLVVVVAVSGCQSGPSTSVPDETPTADELSGQAASAMQSVETSSFTLDMTVEADGSTVEMDADGRMDLPAERMRMDMDMNLGDRDVSATQYVDGTTAYVNVGDRWQQRSLAGQEVWSNNQITQQGDILDRADVRLNGTTVIDGRHAYRLEVDANESVARDLLQQGAGTAAGSLENVDVSRLSFTQYVDVATKRVRQIEMRAEMEVQGQQAAADMTMTFSDFNDDVTIEIPDAATSA